MNSTGIVLATKTCSKCGQEKPVSAFKRGGRSLGFSNRCRDCINAQARANRAKSVVPREENRDGLTLAEVARELGVSVARAEQIEKAALRKLRLALTGGEL